ncbi:hypothetical protein Tco_0169694 [Tanacetum coccineum]
MAREKIKQFIFQKLKPPSLLLKSTHLRDTPAYRLQGGGTLEENLSCLLYLAGVVEKKKQVCSCHYLTVGGPWDLEEIQDKDTSPSEITSQNFLWRIKVMKPPSRGSDSWKIQSMIDNMVWVLIDLPPGCKTVGSSGIHYVWLVVEALDLLCVRGRKKYNTTSRIPQNPGNHWTAVKNILKYLRNTKDMFLVYGGNPEAELRVDCYCDAGFETDRDDTKSQTGYVFILNGGAVDWKSSKQSTTAMSATEAEYIATSEAAMEAVWIRKFISRLGIVPTINEPIRMFCDNSAALHFADEPGVQKGARHYHRRYHYVRESIALGEIRFLKVHTDDNLTDPFTKALPKGKLTQHARSMGLRLASSFM